MEDKCSSYIKHVELPFQMQGRVMKKKCRQHNGQREVEVEDYFREEREIRVLYCIILYLKNCRHGGL